MRYHPQVGTLGEDEQQKKIENQSERAQRRYHENLLRAAYEVDTEIDIVMQDDQILFHLSIKEPREEPKGCIDDTAEGQIYLNMF